MKNVAIIDECLRQVPLILMNQIALQNVVTQTLLPSYSFLRSLFRGLVDADVVDKHLGGQVAFFGDLVHLVFAFIEPSADCDV